MQTARWMGVALYVALSGLLCSAAVAGDSFPKTQDSQPAQPLPAVDGLNGTVSGFGGAANGNGLYGGAGSVAIPLGFRYGLQIDGVVADANTDTQGNVTAAGTAAHLFWRDPSVGLLGAFGAYIHTDAFSGADIFAAAPEGALYLGRFTLEGFAGVQEGHAEPGVRGRLDVATRFFDLAALSYYPTDNLKLSIGHSYISGWNSAIVSAELGLPVFSSGTMPALFVAGSVGEGGNSAVLAGVRVYFGQRDKTLIRRHREDDPLGLSSSLGLVGASGGTGGNGGWIFGNGGKGGAGGL